MHEFIDALTVPQFYAGYQYSALANFPVLSPSSEMAMWHIELQWANKSGLVKTCCRIFISKDP